MRYLKRIVNCVLIYGALYLPFVVIVQAFTGYDFTAAYNIGGIVVAVELALTSVIKIIESKEVKKNELEREVDEP